MPNLGTDAYAKLDLEAMRARRQGGRNRQYSATATPLEAKISHCQFLGYYKNGILAVLEPKCKTESFPLAPQTLEGTSMLVNEMLRDEASAYCRKSFTACKYYKRVVVPGH